MDISPVVFLEKDLINGEEFVCLPKKNESNLNFMLKFYLIFLLKIYPNLLAHDFLHVE